MRGRRAAVSGASISAGRSWWSIPPPARLGQRNRIKPGPSCSRRRRLDRRAPGGRAGGQHQRRLGRRALDHADGAVAGGRHRAPRSDRARSLASCAGSLWASPRSAAEAPHLETERGRVLMRLEFRALAVAMRSQQRRAGGARAATPVLPQHAARRVLERRIRRSRARSQRRLGRLHRRAPRRGRASQTFAARTLDRYDRREAFARSYAYASGPAYGLLLDEYRADLAARAGRVRAGATCWRSCFGPSAYDPVEFERRSVRYGGAAIAEEERITRGIGRRTLAGGSRQVRRWPAPRSARSPACRWRSIPKR